MSRNLLPKILDLSKGGLIGDWREFGGKGGLGAFSMIWRDSACVSEVHRDAPVPSASYCLSFLTTDSKHPRDNRGHDRYLLFEIWD